MTNLEKAAEQKSLSLYQEFLALGPIHPSNSEALQAALSNLRALSGQHGLSVDQLIHEAHSTENSEPHYHQALTLERMISYLRK